MNNIPTSIINSVITALNIYNCKHIAEFNLSNNNLYYIKKIVNNLSFTDSDMLNLYSWFNLNTNTKDNIIWDLHGGDDAYKWVNNTVKKFGITSHYRDGYFVSGYSQNRQKRKPSNPSIVSNSDKPVPESVNYPVLYKRARIMARQKYGLLPNAYATAYLVATYEKLVKERGGIPYNNNIKFSSDMEQ